MKTKVAVLGATGMLGSMMCDVLTKDKSIELIATVRKELFAVQGQNKYRDAEWRILDAEELDYASVRAAIKGASWVVNTLGIIKPYIHDDNPKEIERAIRANVVFPHILGQIATETGARVLQIATDCVYSGKKENYLESEVHDALDVYGKTKSLGETFHTCSHHLRCSVVGPEPKAHVSLLDWLRHQPRNARVKGYTNHRWNGLTTLHFAKMCQGIIVNDLPLPHVLHVIPTGTVSKADLLKQFADKYHREDITITPVEANTAVNRTLATEHKALNKKLWGAAGYNEIPSIPDMIAELSQYDYKINFELESEKQI